MHITLERYRGCLLGLACGDALGTSIEFSSPGSFQPVTTITGGGPFHLKAGQWTDDTSMALCLADSLVQCSGFDPVDQMERYLRWHHDGYLSSNGICFDIGGATSSALHRFERTRDPFAGLTNPNSAGNGSLMRLAPVPMAYSADLLVAVERSADSSRTTHAAQTCIDACRYYGLLITLALQGASKEQLLSPLVAPKPGYWDDHPLHAEIREIAQGSFKHRQPPLIKGTGYVVKSLEAALWAFYNSDSFEDGALKAVNLGDDADSTGAIYGQLAGAYYGEAGTPEAWRNLIAMRPLIEDLADRLYTLSQKRN